MQSKNVGMIAYLANTRKIDPRVITVVNDVAYWFDNEEIDHAIEHAKKRLKAWSPSPEAFNRMVSRLRPVHS